MKKITALILIIVLAITLLASCGGKSDSKTGTASSAPKTSNSANSSSAPANSNAPPASNNSGGNTNVGDNANTPAQQDAKIIKASEIITLEDAARILGTDVEINEKYNDTINPLSLESIKTEYESKESSMFSMTITLFQNATFDTSNSVDKAYLDVGGIAFYNETIRKDREAKEGAVLLEGIGDWAVINSLGTLMANIEIGHGDYSISINIISTPRGSNFNDEEKAAWQKDKLIEAGNLAVERLEAIIK